VQPEYVTGRAILSIFSFEITWAYTVDVYALLAMIVCGGKGAVGRTEALRVMTRSHALAHRWAGSGSACGR
jgi:hypothetical protein